MYISAAVPSATRRTRAPFKCIWSLVWSGRNGAESSQLTSEIILGDFSDTLSLFPFSPSVLVLVMFVSNFFISLQ